MPGWWTAARQAEGYNYLIYNGGLSPHGAAGLISRWANVESTAAGPAARGGYKGRAWGIAQWLGSRLPPIDGNPNYQAQLAYVVRELNSTEAKAGNVLRSARNAQEGARGASMYERAGGYNSATGIDNYTARTGAGIPAVLAIVGGGGAPPNVATGPGPSSGGSEILPAPPQPGEPGYDAVMPIAEAGMISPAMLLLLIGGAALWFVLKD